MLELRIKTLIKYTLALIHQTLTFISENNFQVVLGSVEVFGTAGTGHQRAVFPYDLHNIAYIQGIYGRSQFNTQPTTSGISLNLFKDTHTLYTHSRTHKEDHNNTR